MHLKLDMKSCGKLHKMQQMIAMIVCEVADFSPERLLLIGNTGSDTISISKIMGLWQVFIV